MRTVDEIEQCLDDGTLAVIFHIEGAEAIDTDLHALEVLYQAGLRSLGITWSRSQRSSDTACHLPFPAHQTPVPD